MNGLNYLQAIVLGLIQGITEFLPISSSGHLAVTQQLMDLKSDAPAMLVFDVAAHLGTLIAVFWVFAGSFTRYLHRLRTELSGTYGRPRVAWRIAGLGVAASVPTAVIGLTLKDFFEQAFGKPMWIGIALLVTGTLLYITGKCPRPRRGWKRFGTSRAFGVGLAQAAAILPGISRSGATICVAMMLGLRRRWAGEFSFFIAAPAILGASLIKAKDVADMPREELAALQTWPIVIGALVAMISGYFALRLLLAAVHRAKLQHFCYYCWAAGLAVIVLMNRG